MENRWLRHFQKLLSHDQPRGEFDLYVQFAVRFRWTPQQVNALDPNFLEELIAYLNAENRFQEAERREAERKARLDQQKAAALRRTR